MAATSTCDVKRVQHNSAQAAADQAKADYLSCLGPQQAGVAALGEAQPAINTISKEAETLRYVQNFVLKELARETSAEQTVASLRVAANDEEQHLREEIEEVKSEIRTERRRFLDASPSVTTAIAGVYYTAEPDNQVLIAFLSCFGAFLLFVGLMVIMDRVPWLSPLSQTSGERIKIVVAGWIATIVVTYIFFFTFT